ncbi:MAG: hypothetical protein ABL984_05185 [Pyrinomonadaceae bacterium]
MKKGIFCALLGLVFSAAAVGQTATTNGQGSATSATAVSKQNGALTIASGTEIAGELQNSLNVEKAKVGDEVVLKTKKAIKQNGEVVVDKGAKLIGRVTEVKERAKGEATSRIGVLFDTLKQGDMTMPVQASIVSVVNVAARATAGSTDLWADSGTTASGATRSTSSGSSGSGGLLGGVTSTAGGVVNTATNTAGGVANTATNTVGSVANTTTSAVGSTVNSVGRIQVAQSTDASASGSSTLSLTGGNLKLEKGATFNVALSSSANAGN